MIALDTNLLARLTRVDHSHGSVARAAINKLLTSKERLAIFPQNLYEFWAVATRQPGLPPAGANGLGLAVQAASQWLNFSSVDLFFCLIAKICQRGGTSW